MSNSIINTSPKVWGYTLSLRERGSVSCLPNSLILVAASNLTHSRQSMSIFSDFCAIFSWAGLTGIAYVSTVHSSQFTDSSQWTQWLGSHQPHPTPHTGMNVQWHGGHKLETVLILSDVTQKRGVTKIRVTYTETSIGFILLSTLQLS